MGSLRLMLMNISCLFLSHGFVSHTLLRRNHNPHLTTLLRIALTTTTTTNDTICGNSQEFYPIITPIPPAVPFPVKKYVSTEQVDMTKIVADLANQIVSLNEEIARLKHRIKEAGWTQHPRPIAPDPGWMDLLKKPTDQYVDLSTTELRVRLIEMTQQRRQVERRAIAMSAENDQLRKKLSIVKAEHRLAVQELRSNLNFQIAMRGREQSQHKMELEYARQEYAADLAAVQNATVQLIEEEAALWRNRMTAMEIDLFELNAKLTGTEQRLIVRGEIIQTLEAEKRSLRQITWNGVKLVGSRVAKGVGLNSKRNDTTNKAPRAEKVVHQSMDHINPFTKTVPYVEPTQDPNYFESATCGI